MALSLTAHRVMLSLLLLALAHISVLAQSQNGLEFTNAEQDMNTNSFEYHVTINQNFIVNQTIVSPTCINTQDVKAIITYDLHSESQYFNIDQNSGGVTLTVDGVTLEHDTRYSATIQCSSQTVGSSTKQHLSASLMVHFLVQNEFSPVFDHRLTQMEFTFSEDYDVTGNKSVIFDFNATDRDRGECGQISYSIISQNRNLFRIHNTTGILSFVRQLDYERRSRHTIVIRAKSGNSDRCSSPASPSADTSVVIHVNDTNDTPPQFDQAVYNVLVEEGASPHDIIKVRCQDPDTTSHLVYSVLNLQNIFAISTEGTVSVTRRLNYETNPSFQVGVSCRDVEGSDDQVAKATINVTVSPINEHRPTIEPSSIPVSVEDTAPVGTILVSTVPASNALATYTVTDEDRGSDHGQYNFTLSISNPEDEMYFTIDHETGEVSLKRLLKTQCQQGGIVNTLIGIRVVVCDLPLQLNDECNVLTVTLYVISSECVTYFPRELTVVSVNESTEIGTHFLSIPCRDSINTTTKTVAIVPDSSDAQFFSYDQQRGSLFLLQSLDYEVKQTYTLQLLCTNNYDSTASARVEVTVLPANDNPPFFDKPVYVFEVVNQKQDVPKQVGRIKAEDLDRDVGANLAYSLVNPSGYFELDTSGYIFLSNSLPDSESSFILEARASDGEFSTSTTIVIVQQQTQTSTDDLTVIIIVFSSILMLMVLLLLFSWVFICCLLRRRGKGKYTGSSLYNGAATATEDNDYRHQVPLSGQTMGCLSYNQSSFINDPVFNGSRDTKALPEEPQYEDLPCKQVTPPMSYYDQPGGQPYMTPKPSIHAKAAPQSSVECYVEMQHSVCSPVSLQRADLEKVSDLVGDRSDGVVNMGGSEGPERKVKLNKVGRHESSLEFGGLVETSLEFGARRGLSLDFGGQPAIAENGTTSPRRMNSGNYGADEGGGQRPWVVQESEEPTPSGVDIDTNNIVAGGTV